MRFPFWQRTKKYRVGWVTGDATRRPLRGVRALTRANRIRADYLSRWINSQSPDFHCELYHPRTRYDVVIFLKMMGHAALYQGDRIRASGGKVVFEINVNYYENWGEEFVPFTLPTAEQQRDVIAMTRYADWVIADSSYIASVARQHNPNVTWIPDNVSLEVYRGVRKHSKQSCITIGWSGIPRKAMHLVDILPAIAQLSNMRLSIVAGQVGDETLPPDLLRDLQSVIPCTVAPFTERRLAKTFLECDIVISPKRLCNSYEMGHSENKIAVGMAVGLPAIASPQQSYVEAISDRNGGLIASTVDEWVDALRRLGADWQLRANMGARARETVVTKYSTAAVAQQFVDVLSHLVRH